MADLIDRVMLMINSPVLRDKSTGDRFKITGIAPDDALFLSNLDHPAPRPVRIESLDRFAIEETSHE